MNRVIGFNLISCFFRNNIYSLAILEAVEPEDLDLCIIFSFSTDILSLMGQEKKRAFETVNLPNALEKSYSNWWKNYSVGGLISKP